MKQLNNNSLNRLSLEAFANSLKFGVSVVLDNVRSAHNVGSVFRTADAFALESIYICGISARPPHKEIEKTALGATQSVAWYYLPTTLEACQQLLQQGYELIAVEQTTESIFLHNFEVKNDKKYALIFGNEVEGVQQAVLEVASQCVEIQQFGTKHSLNIAVSVGIVAWQFVQQFAKH